jgi:hypothetical protein
MDTFLRTVAIVIELLILAGVAFSVLKGVKLILFSLGLKPKYNRVINMALISVGIIFMIFCIAHLTTFYPPV